MSDRIMGIIGLALSGFYLWAASIIPESFMMDAIGPSTFPNIIAAIFGICSIYFIARPDPEPRWPALNRLAEIGFTVVVCLFYAILLPHLGFVISTALAASYMSWRLGGKPLAAVLIGLGISVGIYVCFKLVLGLSLATGPLGF
ncbi:MULTISPECIES: tripartite tricarboxylate transporter TctB family protein [unclassified Thalassospira]|uniref:tripartite tricarboxylate transporter TctB family protein n=1 Tax=unclassified Thalassospira TaxID=2648997 RepID=UPI001B16768E|nr:tripartite tricarboxylate transporter TctB family protein [Thalassospira sp.]MBO6773560.1 tripartite tricarboxylate transporter TctB family protein [Thalassospira sp.]